MTVCGVCQGDVASDEEHCPNCGASLEASAQMALSAITGSDPAAEPKEMPSNDALYVGLMLARQNVLIAEQTDVLKRLAAGVEGLAGGEFIHGDGSVISLPTISEVELVAPGVASSGRRRPARKRETPGAEGPPRPAALPGAIRRAAYCNCGHGCWSGFKRAYTGCDCDPAACTLADAQGRTRPCGCIRLSESEELVKRNSNWSWVLKA